MPTDPNAGLIKAIQSQTRSIDANTKALEENNKLLRELNKPKILVGQNPYFERRREEDSGKSANERDAGSSDR